MKDIEQYIRIKDSLNDFVFKYNIKKADRSLLINLLKT